MFSDNSISDRSNISENLGVLGGTGTSLGEELELLPQPLVHLSLEILDRPLSKNPLTRIPRLTGSSTLKRFRLSRAQAPGRGNLYSETPKKTAGRIHDPARRYQLLLYNLNCYML